MNRRRFLAVAATTPLVAGCGGGGANEGGDEFEQVLLEDGSFKPLKAEIEPGETVEWTDKMTLSHTITSAQFHDAATSWDFEGSVTPGGSTTHTFEENGIYEYHCRIHGENSECGAVLVGDVTLDASLPCSGDSGGG
jgi:plastocyanin